MENNDRNYEIIYGKKKERIKDLKKVKTRFRNTNQWNPRTSETREPVDKKGVKNLNIERSEHIIKKLMYSKRVILSLIYYLYVFIHFHVNDSVKV